MIYPDFEGVQPPNQDLSEDIKFDYQEAASILQKSPRGSATLLRLAIQKLCKELGEDGKNINNDIKILLQRVYHQLFKNLLILSVLSEMRLSILGR